VAIVEEEEKVVETTQVQEMQPESTNDFFGDLEKFQDAPVKNNRATTRAALDEQPLNEEPFKDSSESDGEEIP
jgi:hypothetical protein